MSRKKGSGEAVTVGNTTVKLYTFQRGERTIYSLNNYLEGKRQVRQFSDYGEAKREAQSIARRLDSGQRRILALNDEDAWKYTQALDAIKDTGQPLNTAAKEYAEAYKVLDGLASVPEAARVYRKSHAQVKAKRVPEIVQELLEAREHKSERYVRDLRLRLGRFAKDFTGYIGNVTSHDVTLWLKTQRGGDRNHDNFRRAVITLFRFAQRKEYLPEGKTQAERAEARGADSQGDIGIFQPEELRRLLAAATSEVRPYLVLGAFAGVRTEEIKRITWEEINLKTGYIEIKKSKAKTKGRRLIQMQPNLVEWLKLDWKKSGPVSAVSHPERVAYGVTCPATEELPDLPAVTWVRNGLRHSYCTYRFSQIQNEHIVAAEMGNSPAMIFANYRQLATKEQAEEWFGIYPGATSL